MHGEPLHGPWSYYSNTESASTIMHPHLLALALLLSVLLILLSSIL